VEAANRERPAERDRQSERWPQALGCLVQHGGVCPGSKGNLGNAGRNTVIGPRTNLADFSLVKSIPLNERQLTISF
jgi:hypothetical protein